MTSNRLFLFLLSLFILPLALADSTKDCENITNRIYCVSTTCTVLGDRWLWSDTNVVADRNDPSFKKEVIEMLKTQKEWDAIKDHFDKSFQDNDPVFMSNIFIAYVGSKLMKEAIIFKKERWMFFKKPKLCKTSPLECFELSNGAKAIKNKQKKELLSSFLKMQMLSKLEEFCLNTNTGSDKVYLSYKKLTSECSPKWVSLENYCDSISRGFSELSTAINQ